jgi:phosphoglucosamine mutase
LETIEENPSIHPSFARGEVDVITETLERRDTGRHGGAGLFTALRMFKTVVDHRPQPLSDLAGCFHKYPQVLINVPVSRRPPLEEIPEVQAQVAKARAALGEAGRIVLRYSGTENVARVMIEGDEQKVIEREAQAIADVISQQVG